LRTARLQWGDLPGLDWRRIERTYNQAATGDGHQLLQRQVYSLKLASGISLEPFTSRSNPRFDYCV
jgi:hypothetical protein